MLRLSNIRIPIRIAFAILLPIAAFTGFAVSSVLEKRAVASRAESIAAIAEAAPSITNLVHELQKERGSTVGFVASKGQNFKDVVRGQRPASDKALAGWRQEMGAFDRSRMNPAFASGLEAAETKLAALAQTRSKADAFDGAPPEFAAYYTSTIANLLSMIDSVSVIAEHGGVVRQIAALSSVLQRKERAGQERATGAGAFAAGKFAPDAYRNFVRLGAAQDIYNNIFNLNATADQSTFAAGALKGPVIDELNRMRVVAAEAPFGGALTSVTGPQWFEAATRYIDLLKTVEDRLSGDLVSQVRVIVGDARSAFWGVIALFIGLAAITCVLAAIVIFSITRPIASLVNTMGALAKGDFESKVQGIERGDEIGNMSRAVVVFRDAGLEKIRLEGLTAEQRKTAEEERRRNEEEQKRLAAEQAEVVTNIATGLTKLSEGDLTFRIEAAFPPAYQQLKTDFNGAMSQLQDTVTTIVRAAQEMRSGSTEISQAADDLSKRTETQAANLEQTAAAVDQITATVRKTSDGANHAKSVVSKAREDAQQSGEIVRKAVEAMNAIEGSAKQISQIIGVIDEIAFQTNLLALNAGVEAARAGEAGRGFAVVASEVRSLAQRSADAAKEIKSLISASTAQVDSGVNLVGQTGTALEHIVSQVTEINGVVGEIAASAHEQATGLGQVNTAVNQMDQVTQQNAAMVEESTAASHALASEAQKLSELISKFNVGSIEMVRKMSAETGKPKIGGLGSLAQRKPAASAPAHHKGNGTVPSAAVIAQTRGANALAAQPAAAEQGWEEF